MLRLAGKGDVDVAAALNDGRAMDQWRRMITAQGGDVDAPLPKAKHSHTIVAPSSGTLTSLDALQVGVASWRLGAGRERKEDAVQFGAGIELHAQIGSQVVAGAPLMTLFTDDEPRFARALESLEDSFSIGSGSVERKIVIDRIS